MLAGTAILLYLVSGFVSFVIGGRLPRQCQLFSPRCCCSSAQHRPRLKYVPRRSFAVCLYRTPSLRVRCSRSPPLSVFLFLSRSLSLALLQQRGQCNCKIELFMAIVRQSIEIEIKCCCQRAAAASASASASTVVVGFFCCCLWHVRTAIFQFFFPSPLPSVCRIYLFLFILTFWLGLACVRLELWFKVSVSGSIWQAIDCRNVPVCCLTHSVLSLSVSLAHCPAALGMLCKPQAESDLSPISLGFCLFLAMEQFVFGNVACLTLATSSSAAAAAATVAATVDAIQFDLLCFFPFYLTSLLTISTAKFTCSSSSSSSWIL